MTNSIRIERLSENNFSDYEKLTSSEGSGGCYCAFWHQKWSSMAEWDKRKKESPELNRTTVLEKVRSGFHVGVLAYDGSKLLAWVSVGPLVDFYWTWKRTIQVGEPAKTTAGILCFSIAPEFRGQGIQGKILKALVDYGRSQNWTAIEAYPFDESAVDRHQRQLVWPGLTKAYLEAGFERVGPHWLSQADYERSIYRVTLN